MRTHSIPIRIYYEDTDAGGVTYHASYIRFCERGRTEYLRDLGFLNSSLFTEHGMLFVVRHMDVNYLAPTRLDDLCDLHTGIKEMRNTSFVMNQRLERDGQLLFEMDVVIVAVSQEGRPVKIPDPLRKALQE